MRRFWPMAALLLAGCTRQEPLPVLGQVPPFHLTDERGRPFGSGALAGKAWLADFIYTTCQGPCPLMSTKMRRMQRELPPEVHLVSFTVDPANDTPPVLAAYARRYGAEPGRWHFLTGDQAALNDLGRNGFHMNSVDGKLDHSTRFALVDGRGRIRGYYLSTEDGLFARVARDARRVQKEG
ncbi:MAG: SCO family protein [Bryobacteraceae bacterium]